MTMASERTLRMMREAEDPRTLPGRLREIAGWVAQELRQAVAVHPNAPPDLLGSLIEGHPEAVLRNPALPLILLEDPGWAGKIGHWTALRLPSSEDVPAILLSALAARPGPAGQAARLHIGLAGECGPDWEAEAGEALWEASGLPGREVPEALWEAACPMDEGETFPAHSLSLGLVAPWLLGVLAAHGDAAVRRAVARRPEAPQDLLTLLRRAGSTPDLGDLAPPDLTLPASDLAWLAQGGAWAKRLAARHPDTPPAVLARLTREHGESLARPPVQKPSLPAPPVVDKQEVMREMEWAACRSWPARAALLANPNVLARHFVGSLADELWPSRLAIARNPVMLLPELGRPEDGDDLARLARDGNRIVRAAARAALRQRKARR